MYELFYGFKERPFSLLQWITAAFGLSCDSGDQFELHKRFLDFVIQQYADNKRTLLSKQGGDVAMTGTRG